MNNKSLRGYGYGWDTVLLCETACASSHNFKLALRENRNLLHSYWQPNLGQIKPVSLKDVQNQLLGSHWLDYKAQPLLMWSLAPLQLMGYQLVPSTHLVTQVAHLSLPGLLKLGLAYLILHITIRKKAHLIPVINNVLFLVSESASKQK